ncbi:helix-turn-helix domain-containing protein [Sporosarcina sp. YIM B06819]|uniref:helix-turn-helix domain-containing protein n=1 Tax=Sporosarcina sp. YIM B06819 TaxID=3081769 RepID=UPI00298CEF73|nr:helix-turn-helix domain-containing protein [Sporosarcina sp. YIM B06819]
MTIYLKDFARFANTQDMDEAAQRHVIKHWNEMNPTDRAVLDMIRRYSVKYGAAHLKHDTMADKIGKSNVTVRRAIRKLESLGIIERIHYIRPVMNGLGANIYVILPFVDQSTLTMPATADKPCDSEADDVFPEPEAFSFESKNIKTHTLTDTYPAEPAPTPTTLFGRIKDLLSTTIGDNSLARQLFGIYRAQSLRMMKFSLHEQQGDLFERLAIQALHIAVQASKRKTVRNIPGYFDGVLRKLIDKALFEDIFKEYDVSLEGFLIG